MKKQPVKQDAPVAVTAETPAEIPASAVAAPTVAPASTSFAVVPGPVIPGPALADPQTADSIRFHSARRISGAEVQIETIHPVEAHDPLGAPPLNLRVVWSEGHEFLIVLYKSEKDGRVHRTEIPREGIRDIHYPGVPA